MRKLIRLSDRLAMFLMIVAAGWAFVLCFFILAEIISRGLSMPLQGIKEIVANSVVMIVFLQLGFAVRSRSMLQATFLVHLFGARFQHILAALGYLLGAILFLILLHGAIEPAIRSYTYNEFDGEGALRVPVWPARFTIILGSAVAAVNYLLLMIVELFNIEIEDLSI